MTLKLKRRSWYPWLFVTICGILLPLAFMLAPDQRLEAIVAVFGAVGGFTHFIYSQHHQDVQLFHDLFGQFTKRYDELNNDLNAIRMRAIGTPLQPDEKRRLYDYFNLCAEEHLFHEAGYIDHRVWHAWCKGMVAFDDVPEIHALWAEELSTNAYYGFSLKMIRGEKSM